MARSIATSTALVVIYFNVPVGTSSTLPAGILLAIGLAGLIGMLVVQVRSVAQSTRPRLRAVELLATAGPLLLVLFAMSYYLLARDIPSAFSQPLSRLDALYFTVTTFATVGFGDITPKTEGARTAVMVQMVLDLIVVGVGLRVLLGAVKVGLTRQGAPAPPEDDVPLPAGLGAGASTAHQLPQR